MGFLQVISTAPSPNLTTVGLQNLGYQRRGIWQAPGYRKTFMSLAFPLKAYPNKRASICTLSDVAVTAQWEEPE